MHFIEYTFSILGINCESENVSTVFGIVWDIYFFFFCCCSGLVPRPFDLTRFYSSPYGESDPN